MDGLSIWLDPQARFFWQTDAALGIGEELCLAQVLRERGRLDRVFTEFVLLKSRIRLQRSAQRQMRGEGVVNEPHAPGLRAISHLPGDGDAADAARVDLHETQPGRGG